MSDNITFGEDLDDMMSQKLSEVKKRSKSKTLSQGGFSEEEIKVFEERYGCKISQKAKAESAEGEKSRKAKRSSKRNK